MPPAFLLPTIDLTLNEKTRPSKGRAETSRGTTLVGVRCLRTPTRSVITDATRPELPALAIHSGGSGTSSRYDLHVGLPPPPTRWARRIATTSRQRQFDCEQSIKPANACQATQYRHFRSPRVSVPATHASSTGRQSAREVDREVILYPPPQGVIPATFHRGSSQISDGDRPVGEHPAPVLAFEQCRNESGVERPATYRARRADKQTILPVSVDQNEIIRLAGRCSHHPVMLMLRHAILSIPGVIEIRIGS
jgi:hypothetical protein